MQNISGTTIYLTRGDSLSVRVGIKTPAGYDYELQQGDVVRFALKKDYGDTTPKITKTLGSDLMLELAPSDTKNLAFGRYVYDIELTTEEGAVDTFIAEAVMYITKEVY